MKVTRLGSLVVNLVTPKKVAFASPSPPRGLFFVQKPKRLLIACVRTIRRESMSPIADTHENIFPRESVTILPQGWHSTREKNMNFLAMGVPNIYCIKSDGTYHPNFPGRDSEDVASRFANESMNIKLPRI